MTSVAEQTMVQAARPGHTRLGWIGTGVMGSSMCGHLVRAGYEMTVFNRTEAKARPLLDLGARLARSPREVAEASDVVFSIVGFPSDVRAITFGPDGTLAGCRAGSILVDMTTSEPTLAVEIAREAREVGVGAVDAPVSGGDVGAREARLSIMVGAELDDFDSVRPLLEILGKVVVRQGGPGAGQHTKMVNQTLIAGGMVSICEALLYARKAGLDPESVLRSVSSGAAGSWGLANLGPKMIVGNYEPGFYVEHFLKDLGIALAEARRMKLSMPGLALAEQLYRAVDAQGHGRLGTQSLILAMSQLSSVSWGQDAPLPGLGVPQTPTSPSRGLE